MRPASRRALAVLAVLGAGLSSCLSNDLGVREDVALAGFGSCRALEDHIEDQAIRQMNARLDAAMTNFAARAGVPLVPAAVGAGAASAFTTTNTQERDVDEPDFVKNDGARIFALHDRYLMALAAWPAATTRVVSATRLEGHPIEMLLDENRLVVFSQVDLARILARAGLQTPTEAAAGATPFPPYLPGLKITVLDVSHASPSLLFEEYLEGRYLTARRVGPVSRIVSSGGLRFPDLRYWPEDRFDAKDSEAVRRAFEALRARNIELIQRRPLEDWLPRTVTVLPGESPHREAPACGDFYASNASVELGMTTVTTVNLARPLSGSHQVSTLLDASTVYASRDALYLAAPHYWWPGLVTTPDDSTYLHRFDIRSDPSRVRYTASGTVPGHVLNQFSMGEYQGYLRVSTTGSQWRSGTAEQANNVFVLAARAGRLSRVGELREIAPGERIYATRFLGERGYLVTYRKVDPLFTLDLRSPTQPRIAGELKVPGYSTYIHPLDDEHLLTIGRDTVDSGQGFDWYQELTLQVFDVSQPAEPRLQHKEVFGSRSASSLAEYDHKAFNFFPARGLLAIPLSAVLATSRTGGAFRSSLEVFRVGTREGIEHLGSIDHAALLRPEAYRGYPSWTPAVRRSVMMEDFVYSISYGGLEVNRLQNLWTPLVTIPFPDPVPWNAPDP